MQNYSNIQKFLHDFVLSKKIINKSLFELEKIIYLKNKDIKNQSHVFITGLPRSGTTSLLNFLFSSDEYASLTYNNMPFILSPHFSKLFNNIKVIDWGELIDFDMVINATSLGLKKEDKININFSENVKNKFFYDIIYNPNETNFLKQGKKLGNTVENGKMMFIHQASISFKIWHKIKPKISNNLIEILN